MEMAVRTPRPVDSGARAAHTGDGLAASRTQTLFLVLLAAGTVVPLQPFHRCRRTGMKGPGSCCAVRHVEAPACASCATPAAVPSRRAKGETGFHELSGPCCLISYVESPRVGPAPESSRELLACAASNAPALVDVIEIGAEARRLGPHRARAGPELPARPPLFILHASLLL
jgi:hypothetical protein